MTNQLSKTATPKVKSAVAEADIYLARLRAGSHDWEELIASLHDIVARNGLTLSDIGTSKEELEELEVIGCRTSALKWLGHLRKGYDDWKSLISSISRVLAIGGLTFADIGTNEKELEDLKVLGCRTKAVQLLGYLRQGSECWSLFTNAMRKSLKAGELDLASIGTSEKEIKELRVLSHKTSALQWLKYIREGSEFSADLARYMHDSLKAGGLKLVDIYTSEEEIAALLSKQQPEVAG